jgi:hypothetical protein
VGAWSIIPCDASREELAAASKARKKEYDKERARKKREAHAMAKDLDIHEESLLVVLGRPWASVAHLADTLKGARAWRAPNGEPLGDETMRRLVRRSLSRLVGSGLAEGRKVVERSGFQTWQVRRADPQKSADTRARTSRKSIGPKKDKKTTACIFEIASQVKAKTRRMPSYYPRATTRPAERRSCSTPPRWRQQRLWQQ